MKQMIAVCGLDCGPCEARIATQADDVLEKQRIAAKWREEYGSPDIDENYVSCDGCLSGSVVICGWCRRCPMRLCGISRGVATCAHCTEYEACETLAGFVKMAPDTKQRLDKIRAELAA